MNKNNNLDDDKLLNYLIQEVEKTKDIPFIIKPYYDRDGDYLIVYLEDVPSYVKWINHNVSLVLAQDDNRIVGIELEGISKFIGKDQK